MVHLVLNRLLIRIQPIGFQQVVFERMCTESTECYREKTKNCPGNKGRFSRKHDSLT